MNKKIILTTAFFSLVTGAAVAMAEGKQIDNFYVGVNGGVSIPMKFKGDYITTQNILSGKDSYKISGVFGMSVGYKFSQNLRAELAFDFRNKYKYTSQKIKYTGDNNITDGEIKQTQSINSLAIMANAYYDIANLKGITPYIGAGMGLSRNKTKDFIATITSLTNPRSNVTTITAGATKSQFAYQLIAGATIHITDKINLNLAYRYIDLGKIYSADIMNINVTGFANLPPQSGKTIRGKLHANEIVGGIRFDF